MKNNKKIPLSTPTMGGKELYYIKDAFDKNWIAPLGENVNEFEKSMATYVGVKEGAALSSGTAALHLALKCANVVESDIVFCSSFTFAATCNPIIYEKAIPVFIDSDYETWNMNPKALEKAFIKYPHCKAVIVVNLYGIQCDFDPIIELCKKYGAVLIEDAAESLGSDYKGKMTGSFGDYAALSFNGNKIITTSGGGMLLSNNVEKIKKARFWSTQSRENFKWYQHNEIGYNYRMSNIVAGIGRGQVEVLQERIHQKNAIYSMYKKGFESIKEISMMPEPDFGVSNKWLSCILLSKDSKVQPLDILAVLEQENIESRPVWKPMHKQPIFEKYDYIKEDSTDVSSDLFDRGLCLPSDVKMTTEEQMMIIEMIKGLFNHV